jgi:hypothetical protein
MFSILDTPTVTTLAQVRDALVNDSLSLEDFERWFFGYLREAEREKNNASR